ncbi:50S ribosomal protein L30 [Emticicia sp. W12TSBA100-4]|uniref:50S ribosomal protein L30 n=1 Tax=Emticicia sp. W12TSBA100-4 TaxID=3160965 RepID=UPI003305EADC
MAKVKITQVRSIIGRPEVQKRTIAALGLGKLNRTVEKELNPAMQGMINSVKHLLVIEEA